MAANNGSSATGMPPEVLSFLSGKGGRSLIVKGGAGTGKTTFGLELLERIGKPHHSYYLSTRVGDEALYRQFPWLKATEMRSRILDAGKLFLDTINAAGRSGAQSELPESEQRKIAAAREMMRSFGEERGPPTRVDRTHLTALLKRNPMPEVENVYNRIEKALPEKSLLVIDSLEGVTHKYGLEMEEFVMALQKDLVESSNTDVVMILEKPEAGGIEYLVDGLISIQREELDERRVRHMRLEKLRATAIARPRYAVTLADGRFEALGFGNSDHVSSPGAWHPVGDPERFYSTGIPDFDALLGGGFRRGSFNAFEVDVNVGIDDYYMLFTPTLLNFLSQGRGIIAVLAAGESHEKLRETVNRYTPPHVFDTRVRVADYTANETDLPYIVPMARFGRDEALRAMVSAEKAARGPEQKPFLEYTAFDTLESLMGDQVAIRMYFHGVQRTKLVGNCGIGLLKPGLLVSSEILNMMDTYFRIINIDNAPCIYGIRPRTTIYSISIDTEKGAPHAKLTPIV